MDQQQTATVNELALQLLPILSIPASPADPAEVSLSGVIVWDWTPY